jgi:hypothetical protein
MSKRRTKKEKINPKRNITISWEPNVFEAKNPGFEANVKRQLSKRKDRDLLLNKAKKIAITTDKNDSLASVKKDLGKSLIFASLIIASEVVIYLVWY